ncbi:hypothetical protein ERJ75_000437800 [Trypanosoma vivax]|nr:hypothetical protein ERJ75_000437800 [Trypanosoma vivax]
MAAQRYTCSSSPLLAILCCLLILHRPGEWRVVLARRARPSVGEGGFGPPSARPSHLLPSSAADARPPSAECVVVARATTSVLTAATRVQPRSLCTPPRKHSCGAVRHGPGGEPALRQGSPFVAQRGAPRLDRGQRRSHGSGADASAFEEEAQRRKRHAAVGTVGCWSDERVPTPSDVAQLERARNCHVWSAGDMPQPGADDRTCQTTQEGAESTGAWQRVRRQHRSVLRGTRGQGGGGRRERSQRGVLVPACSAMSAARAKSLTLTSQQSNEARLRGLFRANKMRVRLALLFLRVRYRHPRRGERLRMVLARQSRLNRAGSVQGRGSSCRPRQQQPVTWRQRHASARKTPPTGTRRFCGAARTASGTATERHESSCERHAEGTGAAGPRGRRSGTISIRTARGGLYPPHLLASAAGTTLPTPT